MKRYKKFVFEAQEGINLEVSEEEKEELIIKAMIGTGKCQNYQNPPIPYGYRYVTGEWYSGFVIERLSDGSQFVWIPVGYLDANGTLDGVVFNRKFGRRNYQKDRFSSELYHETFNGELKLQAESVKKHGGFYFSRYNISKNEKTGKPQSVKGERPWTGINFDEAMQISATMETSYAIKSHLIFGAEYDSVLEWIIKSKAKSYEEIACDSTDFGNYDNTWKGIKKVAETDSKKEWQINNICDLAGNVSELTQEQFHADSQHVRRGGSCFDEGDNNPVSFRLGIEDIYKLETMGFRIALYIK